MWQWAYLQIRPTSLLWQLDCFRQSYSLGLILREKHSTEGRIEEKTGFRLASPMQGEREAEAQHNRDIWDVVFFTEQQRQEVFKLWIEILPCYFCFYVNEHAFFFFFLFKLTVNVSFPLKQVSFLGRDQYRNLQLVKLQLAEHGGGEGAEPLLIHSQNKPYTQWSV